VAILMDVRQNCEKNKRRIRDEFRSVSAVITRLMIDLFIFHVHSIF
jgi:hypothetical protein